MLDAPSSRAAGVAPLVRVVVVNYNAGRRLLRCLQHLAGTDWPKDRLELVVVDNASTDGSADELAARWPEVKVLRSPANLGFAGGSNFGMRDLENVDYVALVNNDAFVDPGWLSPLVKALVAPDAGAACPKLLFEPRFVELRLTTEAFLPGPHDTRQLGVRISGVRCHGVDGWRMLKAVDGGYWEESTPDEAAFRWLKPTAVLWAPVPTLSQEPAQLRVRLQAEREKHVVVDTSNARTELLVGPSPQWFDIAIEPPYFDVVNNAGSVLVEGGFGADRGFWEQDKGQFDEPEEVFAWCGAAVLLSAAYLRDVGLFDDEYFLYYEDFDLAWRGRLRGWRYCYVPESVVRHIHSATTVEGSLLFDHYVSRNRLLTLMKNAPLGFFARQLVAYADEVRCLVQQELVRPAVRREPIRINHTRRRVKSGAAFFRHLPHALKQRREVGERRTVDRGALLEWATRR